MRTWCFGYLRKTGNLSHNFFDKKTYQRCSSPDFKFDLFVSGRLCLNRGSAGVWLHFLEDDPGSITCVNESRLGEVATFFWEGIPMDHSQRKEGILKGILASVALTECHGVAISGYPMSGLDVIGKGHSHEAINLLLYKRDQTVHWLSLFKCLPAQLVQQWNNASHSGIIILVHTGLRISGPFQSYGHSHSPSWSQVAEAYCSWGHTRVW